MKKLLAALAAAGLMIGLAGTFGSTATASVRPHIKAQPTFTITATPTTGLSKTAETTISVNYSGAGDGDAIEYGICNDDGSQPSPLAHAHAACTKPQVLVDNGTGSGSFEITLKPGKQGTSTLSGCPQSKAQYGLGIQCIVAAEDINVQATADIPLYFASAEATVAGTDFTGVITATSGFATSGLYGATPAALTNGCQSFSTTEPSSAPNGWTGLPLCDDGAYAPAGVGGPLPYGDGYAAGEPVVVLVGSTKTNGAPVCNPEPGSSDPCPSSNADQPSPVTDPGGVTYSYVFPAKGTYYVTLEGAGSDVVNGPIKVTVSASGKVS